MPQVAAVLVVIALLVVFTVLVRLWRRVARLEVAKIDGGTLHLRVAALECESAQNLVMIETTNGGLRMSPKMWKRVREEGLMVVPCPRGQAERFGLKVLANTGDSPC